MVEWSVWQSYTLPPAHNGPAVYQFRKVVDGVVAPVQRWGGTDPDGILLFGETDNMFKRWGQSRTAIDRGSGSSTLNLLHYVVAYSDLTDGLWEECCDRRRRCPRRRTSRSISRPRKSSGTL